MATDLYQAPSERSVRTADHNHAHSHGVSWAAVFAGAFAMAALELILLSLGAGLGVSSMSPWSNMGASASALGKGAIVWLIVAEVLSSALGGYLAGRLRTKWSGIHNDEVYFRDTAHGFIAWSVALVVTAAFLTSAAATLVGSGSKAATDAADSAGNAYFTDSLYRGDAAKEGANQAVREESSAILARGLAAGSLDGADQAYLSQVVSAKTGLSSADASSRVSSVFSQAQQAAETTRKAVAHGLLWTFIALLFGAFCASFSATIGGRQRDNVVTL